MDDEHNTGPPQQQPPSASPTHDQTVNQSCVIQSNAPEQNELNLLVGVRACDPNVVAQTLLSEV